MKNSATTCPTDERLRLLLNGTLTEPAESDLETHISKCTHCESRLDALSNCDELPKWQSLWRRTDESASQVSVFWQDQDNLPFGQAEQFERPQLGDRFELIEQAGRGGMGTVYKARQKTPERIVAIKVLNAQLNDRINLHRLLREADVIAAIQHNNVVRVFEVVANPQQPCLVLEYVEGPSLAEWLDRQPQEPLTAAKICLDIARGVESVHRNDVIHRDLKPSNILLAPTPHAGETVTTEMESFILKVADFGLAKDLQVDDRTRTGQFIGTPAYMSPEQISGHNDVGFASDVYAIGVILYETLLGFTPFRSRDPFQLLRRIETAEPIQPRRENRMIPADLEAICLKCLEKEPGRRYPNASALADDLSRFLDGKPVAAKPVTNLTRAVKWMRRNPTLAALIATAITGVMVATILWGTFTARIQSVNSKLVSANTDLETQKSVAIQRLNQANEQKAITDAVNGFLQSDLLRQASAEEQLDWLFRAGMHSHSFVKNPSLADVLKRAATRLVRKDNPFRGQEKVRATLFSTIGDTYRSLGDFENASKYLGLAEEILASQSDSAKELATTQFRLAETFLKLERFSEFHSSLQKATSNFEKCEDVDSAMPLRIKRLQAESYIQAGNHPQRALKLAQTAHQGFVSMSPGNSPDLWGAAITLAKAYRMLEEYDTAIRILNEVIANTTRDLGDLHPATLEARFELALASYLDLQFQTAYGQFLQLRDDATNVLGEDHPTTLFYQMHLAFTLAENRKLDLSTLERAASSISMLKDAQQKIDNIFPKNHPVHAQLASMLADRYSAAGKHQDALRVLRLSLDSLDEPVESVRRMKIETDIAKALNSAGQVGPAIDQLAETMTKAEQTLAPSHSLLLDIKSQWAVALIAKGEFRRAAGMLKECFLARCEQFGPQKLLTVTTGVRMLTAMFHDQDFENVEVFATKILDDVEGKMARTDSTYLAIRQAWALSLAHQKKWADAEVAFAENAAIYIEHYPNDSSGYRYLTHQGAALAAIGKFAEAESVLKRAWKGLNETQITFSSDSQRKQVLLESVSQFQQLYHVWNQPEELQHWTEVENQLNR